MPELARSAAFAPDTPAHGTGRIERDDPAATLVCHDHDPITEWMYPVDPIEFSDSAIHRDRAAARSVVDVRDREGPSAPGSVEKRFVIPHEPDTGAVRHRRHEHPVVVTLATTGDARD